MSNPIIFFDPLLGQQLKTFRIKHKIKANDLAAHIEKSPAYISKIENGEIKTIQKSALKKIVNYIANSEDGYSSFIAEISANLDTDFLEKSNFISNFDWIDRLIPIPADYLTYINEKIKDLRLSYPDLADYINLNEDLDDTFLIDHNIDKDTVEPNCFHIYYEADSQNTKRNYIIVKVSTDLISSIFSGEIDKTSYLNLYIIVYHLLKYETKNNVGFIDDNKKDRIKLEVSKKLREYKIYTIPEKQSALKQAFDNMSPEDYLAHHDIVNNREINKITDLLHLFSEKDIEYTNKKLESISSNLFNYNSFALAYMALDLSSLAELSVSQKKEFLANVESLIKDYAERKNEELEKF